MSAVSTHDAARDNGAQLPDGTTVATAVPVAAGGAVPVAAGRAVPVAAGGADELAGGGAASVPVATGSADGLADEGAGAVPVETASEPPASKGQDGGSEGSTDLLGKQLGQEVAKLPTGNPAATTEAVEGAPLDDPPTGLADMPEPVQEAAPGGACVAGSVGSDACSALPGGRVDGTADYSSSSTPSGQATNAETAKGAEGDGERAGMPPGSAGAGITLEGVADVSGAHAATEDVPNTQDVEGLAADQQDQLSPGATPKEAAAMCVAAVLLDMAVAVRYVVMVQMCVIVVVAVLWPCPALLQCY